MYKSKSPQYIHQNQDKKKTAQELAILYKITGDSYYFSLLYKKIYPFLLNHVSNLVKKSGLIISVEDICSAAFERAYSLFHTYNTEYNFSTWLYTIAHNEFLFNVKEAKKLLYIGDTDTAPKEYESNHREYSVYLIEDTSQENIEFEKDFQEKYNLLVNSINQLPPKFRDIVYDQKIKGLSCIEIAQKYGLNYSTTRQRVFHGMNKLFSLLFKKGIIKNKKEKYVHY